jgi:hypothetical protein
MTTQQHAPSAADLDAGPFPARPARRLSDRPPHRGRGMPSRAHVRRLHPRGSGGRHRWHPPRLRVLWNRIAEHWGTRRLDADAAPPNTSHYRRQRSLDTLILRLHTETACRRALALRPCDLDPDQCLIRLREQGEAVRWQPVSPTLMARIYSSTPTNAARRQTANSCATPMGGRSPHADTSTSGSTSDDTCPGWPPSRSARTGCATPPRDLRGLDPLGRDHHHPAGSPGEGPPPGSNDAPSP